MCNFKDVRVLNIFLMLVCVKLLEKNHSQSNVVHVALAQACNISSMAKTKQKHWSMFSWGNDVRKYFCCLHITNCSSLPFSRFFFMTHITSNFPSHYALHWVAFLLHCWRRKRGKILQNFWRRWRDIPCHALSFSHSFTDVILECCYSLIVNLIKIIFRKITS